jgi:stage V sporulation protein D (sporulation-specific penicillin-binding protein)
MKERERLHLRMRAMLVFACLCLAAVFLLYRLFTVQVRDGVALAAQAHDEQRSVFDVSGKRGEIVDRFGVPFATNVPAEAIYAQPQDVVDAPAAAKALSKLLRIPEPTLLADLDEKTTFVYLLRDVPQPIARSVMELGLRGIGASGEPTGIRVDPQGRIGSTIVGFTGIDNQGLAGVEYAFNDMLAGSPGTVSEITDNAGRPIPFGRKTGKPAVVGDTVVLTIDRMLQFEAEDVLARTVRQYDAQDGSAIIMRAQTGEILALANYPNFDPNAYWKSPAASWRDRAVTDPYEPGSTFKIVTATAALDSGLVSLDDTFPAVDAIEVGNRIIHNADDGMMASGHSRETIDDIVTFSHNVGAAEIALRIGKPTMYEYIRRFGFDEPTGVDLPGESGGLIGTPDAWYGSRLATIGFGQGVSVTALALARAYAAVANGGELMRPMIVRDVLAPNGSMVHAFHPEPVRRVMKPQTAAELMAILRDVVRRGTGESVRLPGYAIAGKTGTAQMVIDGEYVPGAYTASFAGIIPADKPTYVILIKIDRPRGQYYGSIVAAPAFAELASRVLWREDVLPSRSSASIDDPDATRGAGASSPGIASKRP